MSKIEWAALCEFLFNDFHGKTCLIGIIIKSGSRRSPPSTKLMFLYAESPERRLKKYHCYWIDGREGSLLEGSSFTILWTTEGH